MKRLIVGLAILLAISCQESETLGLLEYRVLTTKPGFSVSYSDQISNLVDAEVDDIVWFINFPIATGSKAAITALGKETNQKLTVEIWYQGVRLATDTDSADFPLVSTSADLK